MPHRQNLLNALQSYQLNWCKHLAPYQTRIGRFDVESARLFTNFAGQEPNCFERSNLHGHMTGSALVMNHDLTKVLLTHHKKLGMWLQLGGHADGHPITHEVAMGEALEESGIKSLEFLPYERSAFGTRATTVPLPFDLDRHLIPANSRDPEHYHYDVRYLLINYSDETPVVSEESHDVRWFTLDEARRVTKEVSMLRQFSKVEWVRKILKL
jgi:8-oxo-dGTP pyrophosphatase MutT (NUDIX family)